MIQFLQTVFLGIVQGLTEPLPVSSSAHLLIVPWLFGWAEADPQMKLTFDLALHLGTTLALLLFFGRDIRRILVAFLPGQTKPEAPALRRLGLSVALGCVPAGAAVLLFRRWVEDLRNPVTTVLPLILFGLLLLLADRRSQGERAAEDVTWLDALIIGAMQALALIPGASRSGVTITGGLFRGLRRDEAARFSFLMMTPLMVGASLLKGREVFKELRGGAWPDFWRHDLWLLAVGVFVSFLVGYLCIRFFLRFLQKFPLDGFVFYRIALAALVAMVAFLRL